MNPLIHFILIPIGIALGYFVAATAASWKAADMEQLHAQQLKEVGERAYEQGRESAYAEMLP